MHTNMHAHICTHIHTHTLTDTPLAQHTQSAPAQKLTIPPPSLEKSVLTDEEVRKGKRN